MDYAHRNRIVIVINLTPPPPKKINLAWCDIFYTRSFSLFIGVTGFTVVLGTNGEKEGQFPSH